MGEVKVQTGMRVLAGCLLSGAMIHGAPAKATVTRNDVVIMKNGDRLSGNVKKLENGVLYLETTYYTGSLGVDWNQVKSIESTARFQIVLNNGQRLTGTIEKTQTNTQKEGFVIRESGGEMRIAAAEVAQFDQEKRGVWRQLKGSVDESFSFTSGNSARSLNSDGTVTYETTRWSTTASISTSFNGQSGADKTNRIEGQLASSRFLSRDSFLIGVSDFLHSSQQDLELRTVLGGGYGRYWIRKTDEDFAWVAGAVYTNEQFSKASMQVSGNNVEALLGLKYDLYRFNFGEIHSQVFLYPGISDSGRVRLTTNNSLTIALPNNFHLTFSFWDNFDSRPPIATAKRNELGVASGIGWSF